MTKHTIETTCQACGGDAYYVAPAGIQICRRCGRAFQDEIVLRRSEEYVGLAVVRIQIDYGGALDTTAELLSDLAEDPDEASEDTWPWMTEEQARQIAADQDREIMPYMPIRPEQPDAQEAEQPDAQEAEQPATHTGGIAQAVDTTETQPLPNHGPAAGRRKCPKCGHQGDIVASLNEIRAEQLVADCTCKCGHTWEEHFNRKTGETTNYPVLKPRR